MSKPTKILPYGDSYYSCKIDVKDGEYLKLCALGLENDVTIEVYQHFYDPCNCIDEMKPYAIDGCHMIMAEDCSEGVIAMPGCYSFLACVPEELQNTHQDFSLFVETCRDLDNLQTALLALAIKC